MSLFVINKSRIVIVEKCWEKRCLDNKDHVIVCTNCGKVDDFQPIKEFCSFHDNNCKIIVQSTYFRKYYLNKLIFKLTKKYDLSTKNKNRIIADFEKISNVLPLINGNRRRMININFIMILNNMQISIDYIKIAKLKKPFNIMTTSGTIYWD